VILDELQLEVAEWTKKFHGDGDPNPLLDALAVAEEAGEVCRAALKRANGIREGDWSANLREEAADVVITLLSLAANEGWSLSEAVDERWEEVRTR
jgi:NTP pyrophosphatase (non-canonical NTP hydrolase)